MLKNKNKVLKIALFTTLFIVVNSVAVWILWNWLMPTLFGLLVLSRILFGGLRGRMRGGGRHARMRMMEKLKREESDEDGQTT